MRQRKVVMLGGGMRMRLALAAAYALSEPVLKLPKQPPINLFGDPESSRYNKQSKGDRKRNSAFHRRGRK